MAHAHAYSWKGALEFADANAARDDSPLVICSDLPEADFQSMPEFQTNESALFSPLSYYKVRAEVVPMPRALNQEAQRIGRRVFLQAAIKRQRFLALGFRPSYPTLEWLINLTSLTHAAHVLGEFDGVAVIEFEPRKSPRW